MIVGVLVACALFARRVAHLIEVTSVLDPDGATRIYTVDGPACFVSSNDLVYQFDYARDPDNVVIDMSSSQIWDASSVAAMDAVTTKYARRGKSVEIVGLNEASAHMRGRLAGQLGQPH